MARARVDLIQQVPLFQGLERRELEDIASTMKERSFRAGETLTEEGTGGAAFFVIAEGEAEVTAGGERRRTLGPGDHFGEIALIAGTDRTATITAKTDMRCYGMAPWDFKPLVETNSEIAWKLLQSMGRMLRDSG